MSQTSLKYWINRRLAWLLVLVMACGTISSLSLIDWLFDRFEYRTTQAELVRAAALLDRDSKALAAVAADYGFWDDTSTFLNGNKPDYWVHFTPTLMLNSDWDWVLIRDQQFSPFSSVTLRDGVTTALAEADVADLSRVLSQRCTTQSSQINWLADQPFLFAQAPIAESAEHTAQGCIVFGRWLDSDYREQIASMSGVEIRLTPLTAADQPLQNLSVVSLDSPSLAVRVYTETRKTLSKQRWMTALVLLGNMVFLTSIVLFALGELIQRKIVSRLEQFAALADRYLLTRDHRTRWPVQDHDEIDHLGHALNALAAEIEGQIRSIAYDADHDALTGIGNRRFLLRTLQEALSALEARHGQPSCLLLIDLDGFKLINDHLGHALGDTALCLVAHRLKATLRTDDTVVRIGGDEFAVWLPNTDQPTALSMARQLCAVIAQPLPQVDGVSSVTASIGVAPLERKLTPTALLRNADLAMYEAKRRGKNQAVVFDQAIHQAFTRRAELEAALRVALEQHQIEAWFQPIVDGHSRQIRSVEALARWRLNGLWIAPDEFIPIAEEAGLIGELGRQMLLNSCAVLRRLHDLGWSVSCSVNVSIRQFSEGDLGAEIIGLLQAHQLAPGVLHLEVTESLIAQREVELSATLNRLSALGLRLHLDDFGTGYSSLSRLQQLPLHALKIDRSFVTPLSDGHTVMVHTIVEMARSLGLQVIAEGVETLAQYELLCQLEVDLMQGYLFAKPMPEAELLDWLAQHRPL
ncbi:MAG: EAL domain-containing protein [Moraxellaceae bacterium]